MNKPIIDPSTLSEEQREAIRERYALLESGEYGDVVCGGIIECESDALAFAMDEYEWLFGSEFFKKGE